MTGSRLDPWIDSYADRALGMTASEIRALFAVASRPEVVSLAGGMPYVNALPMDAIADTVRHMLLTRGDVALHLQQRHLDDFLVQTGRAGFEQGVHGFTFLGRHGNGAVRHRNARVPACDGRSGGRGRNRDGSRQASV